MQTLCLSYLSLPESLGGPLASARAEAASLLQLLRDVRQRYSNQVQLLIFVDCLVVLDIIRKGGRSDFHPSPKEVVHFAVMMSNLSSPAGIASVARKGDTG